MSIDSDRQDAQPEADVPDVPDVPRTPHPASDFGFLDGTNMARSPIPSNNDPASPLPFQPEIENHHDQAEPVFSSSTIYHSFINGMT